MKRVIAAAILSLFVAQAQASSDMTPAEEECASAFLNQRMGQQDAAILMKLWGMDPAKVPPTTLAAETVYDGQTADLAAAKFLELMGEYQVVCPTSGLEFE